MKALDLFSGIGGWTLACEACGIETAAACELDDWKRAQYAAHFPTARLYRDVKELTARRLAADGCPAIDLVCGSPPCQDASAANHRGRGVDGEDTGLFFEAIRLVDEIRPHWCAFENSPRLRTRGVDRVLIELERVGYACWPLVVGAIHVGAPHLRQRLWLVAADADRAGLREQSEWSGGTRRLGLAEPAHHVDANGEGQSRLSFDAEVGGCARADGSGGRGADIADPHGKPWGSGAARQNGAQAGHGARSKKSEVCDGSSCSSQGTQGIVCAKGEAQGSGTLSWMRRLARPDENILRELSEGYGGRAQAPSRTADPSELLCRLWQGCRSSSEKAALRSVLAEKGFQDTHWLNGQLAHLEGSVGGAGRQVCLHRGTTGDGAERVIGSQDADVKGRNAGTRKPAVGHRNGQSHEGRDDRSRVLGHVPENGCHPRSRGHGGWSNPAVSLARHLRVDDGVSAPLAADCRSAFGDAIVPPVAASILKAICSCEAAFMDSAGFPVKETAE